MDDTELNELLRAADPHPESTPLDPAAVSRVVTRTQEVVRMESQQDVNRSSRRRPGARRMLALAAVLGAVAIAVVAGVSRLTDDGGGGTGQEGGVALGGGSTMTSCIVFSEQELARAPVAFDGTVTSIDGDDVTLSVEQWYRGGSGDTVTLYAPDLAGSLLEGGVGFEDGGRYLVSAYENEGKLSPSVCGFTVTYSDEMAATFERAFGA